MTTELVAATSPSLVWSEELVLGLPAIDQTHVEFVELLAATELADDEQLLDRLQALTDHTVDHFGREDQWMTATAFAPVNCHGMQHRVVLQTLEELLRRPHIHYQLLTQHGLGPDPASGVTATEAECAEIDIKYAGACVCMCVYESVIHACQKLADKV